MPLFRINRTETASCYRKCWLVSLKIKQWHGFITPGRRWFISSSSTPHPKCFLPDWEHSLGCVHPGFRSAQGGMKSCARQPERDGGILKAWLKFDVNEGGVCEIEDDSCFLLCFLLSQWIKARCKSICAYLAEKTAHQVLKCTRLMFLEGNGVNARGFPQSNAKLHASVNPQRVAG